MGGGTLEEGSSFPSSKRRRRRHNDDDYPKLCACASRSCQPPKKHLFLALDDWNGGYSIHRLDADDILDQDSRGENKLPEPVAVRIASPGGGPMAFAALGTTIFVVTNPCRRGDRTLPLLVYDTKTAALTVGPRAPDAVHDFDAAMAVGETLYALTTSPFPMSSSLQALSWVPAAVRDAWDPTMEWRWSTAPSPRPPPFNGIDVTAYAVHPDARTVFVSEGISTYALDTGDGTWKKLGDWPLPFRGQAFFDSGLDAWVGLHREYDGWVCCCPFASLQSTGATRQPPECRMLREKLVRRKEEDPRYWLCLIGKATSLTYMGDSRFALFENVLRSGDLSDGCVIHVTLFTLGYNHRGELKTKARRATRSYAVPKNTRTFCHAAFWM